ncbi:T9SS type A sorting domain-containing protein [Aegicerativicinus sediminis]|uniref:T9SS type A sorting domain-containing protein n=1 Tax=Aegicerativicinus sediminis TaxID=2893202 RepID=UPI001E2C96CE|nr:T9SS type A sorting domain-containing protein [Aegicerativicinus sediminis]
MKKITLTFLLSIICLMGFGQTFDFNGTDDGWTETVGCAISATSTALSIDLTGDATNPNFGTLTAGIDGSVNKFVGINVLNSNPNGPTFMRVSYPKSTSGRVYINMEITAGDEDYKTYWFDLANAEWGDATEDDIKIHFKATGNSNYTVPAEGVSILFNQISFVDAIPRQEKLVYEFDTGDDFEGWDNLVDASATVQGGSLIISPTGGAIAKVTNTVNAVNADGNNYMYIFYKNLSPSNNQLRIQFRSSIDGYTAYTGTNVTINQSMSEFEALSINLETAKPTEWSGTTQDFQIAIRNTNNGGNVASADGDLEIDRIVFSNDATLSSKDLQLSYIQFYPNPAKERLFIKTEDALEAVDIFDVTGKNVLTSNHFRDSIDISTLNRGLYLVKITAVNQSIMVKKLIKD